MSYQSKNSSSGRKTFPPMLNILSTEADDAGRAKCVQANLAKVGYLLTYLSKNQVYLLHWVNNYVKDIQ